MKFDDLVARAKEAIDAVFGYEGVSVETSRDALADLGEFANRKVWVLNSMVSDALDTDEETAEDIRSVL